jgi:uncharacterized protein YjeT (DUF2065 family)
MSYISAIILVLYGLALIIYPRKIQKWAIDLNDSVWGKFFFFRDWHTSDGYIYMLRLMGTAALAMGIMMIHFSLKN